MITFDLDSTYVDAHGNQESIAHNKHYGTVGFYPLVAFDSITTIFLNAEPRRGNVYISDGAVDLTQLAVNNLGRVLLIV